MRTTRALSTVVGLCLSLLAPLHAQSEPLAGGPFVRGDVNQDGTIDIADPVAVLLHLFTPFVA